MRPPRSINALLRFLVHGDDGGFAQQSAEYDLIAHALCRARE